MIKLEQAAGRLATSNSGNRALGNNVVTLKDYGLTKMVRRGWWRGSPGACWMLYGDKLN